MKKFWLNRNSGKNDKNSENILQQKTENTDFRSSIIKALNKSINIFTSRTKVPFDEVITNSIYPVMEAADLSGVIVFRNISKGGEKYFQCLYNWDKKNSRIFSSNTETNNVPDIPVIKRWYSVLSDSRIIKKRKSDMDNDELAFAELYGIVSMMIFPIFNNDEFWGGVIFHEDESHLQNDGYSESHLNDEISDLLFSAARLCANSVINDETLNDFKSATEYDLMRYRLTSDALNIALWDIEINRENPVDPNNYFSWSQEFRHLIGFSDETDFPNLLSSWSNRLHPDDKDRTLKAFFEHMSDSTGKTPYNLEYRLMLKNGEYRHFHAFGATLRDRDGIPLRTAGAMEDINDKKQMEADVINREKVISALNEISIILLLYKDETFENALNTSCIPAAYAAELDKIIIHKLTETKAGKQLEQIYRWDKTENHSDNKIRIIPDLPATRKWIELMSKGNTINIHKGIASGDEIEILNMSESVSLFLSPVFTNEGLWGVVSYHDNNRERLFDDNNANLLTSASQIYINAVIRHEKTQIAEETMKALEYREKMTEMLNDAAVKFLSQDEENIENTISEGIKHIAEILDLDNVSVFRNFEGNDGTHASQVYRWHRDENGETKPLEQLADITFEKFAPRWEQILKDGMTINSPARLLPEAKMLGSFGIISVFVAPVFINNALWGFVVYEDYHSERFFDEQSSKIMSTSAFLCVNTIIMNDKAQNMKNAISTLNIRERMLDAMYELSMSILSNKSRDHKSILGMGLKPVSKITGTDRIAVYRIINDKNQLSQIYLWRGETIPLEKELEIVPEIAPVKNWVKTLSEGTHINANVKELPEDAAEFLTYFGVKSIFFVPIFMHGEFWGIITLEDHTNYRYYDETCLDLLRSTAYLCANTIERSEVEEKATNADEFRRFTLDAMPLGFTVIDENINFIDCNNTIAEQLKTTKEYYLENFFDFSTEYQSDGLRSDEKAIEIIKNVLGSGEQAVVKWTHKTLTGELVPSEITVTRTFHNNKYLLLCFQYDLSNMEKLENTVSEAEKLTIAVKEASPLPYVLFGDDMRPVDCNDAMLQILGCLHDKQYLLDHYWELFVPKLQPNGENSFEEALLRKEKSCTSEPQTFEWYHRSISGELIPMENTFSNVVYQGKNMVISFKYDLRNSRRMIENIRSQSGLLKNRLEQQELISEISKGFISSGDSSIYVQEAISKLGIQQLVSVVVIFSLDYENKTFNAPYYWSADNTPIRYADIDLYDFVLDNFPERLPDCSTTLLFSCPDINETTNKVYRKMLLIGVQSFICIPIYVEGRLWGILSVENKQPRQWTDNEKEFVKMVTSTISGFLMRDYYNSKLKEALEKAMSASRAKSDFLSNMSHEMRTPLNAIIGMTMIAKNALDMKQKNYALNKIENASTHLLGVINDVLDMSKIEANKLELSFIEFNFERMLQKTIAIINFRAEEKHQKLTVRIDETIPESVIGDDQRIIQVITNLLSNAVKFTPKEGSIHLDVCYLGEKRGVCTIKISVTDTGIGISPEQQRHLFQSFQQAEASTARKYGGTGLGLTISKNIVEMMDGKIWVESEAGKGATFVFTIQVKRGKEEKKKTVEHIAKWKNIRMLVVDDDPVVLDFFSYFAQRNKLNCDVAIGGEEAIRLVEKNGRYDIYFIDYRMPNIDGITLSATLKSLEKTPGNSIVIMISAVEWHEIEKEAKEAGIDRFLAKPLFPSSIIDTISECLGMEQEQKTVETQGDSLEGHHILLVEDVEINREIVLTLLEPTRLGIDCAGNGIEAIEIFSRNPDKYEIIFMDIQMPEMDGFEATKRIRDFEVELERSGRPHKPVTIVAMTANVFKEDIHKCMEAGMNDHIGKPLDFEIVMEKLRYYLKKNTG